MNTIPSLASDCLFKFIYRCFGLSGAIIKNKWANAGINGTNNNIDHPEFVPNNSDKPRILATNLPITIIS